MNFKKIRLIRSWKTPQNGSEKYSWNIACFLIIPLDAEAKIFLKWGLEKLRMVLRNILRMLYATSFYLYIPPEANFLKNRPSKRLECRMALRYILRMLPPFWLYCRKRNFSKIGLENISEWLVEKKSWNVNCSFFIQREVKIFEIGFQNTSEWLRDTFL